MGVWGNKLYDNDFVLDIIDDYIDGLKKGMSDEAVTYKLIDTYVQLEEADKVTFWIVLADIEWKYGRLTDRVKKKTLHILDNKNLIDKWASSWENLKEQRLHDALCIQKRISQPMPLRKRITRTRLYRCEWKIGDVFEYRISNDTSERHNGGYFYFIKCGECPFPPGHIGPEIYLFRGIYKEKQSVNEIKHVGICPVLYPRMIGESDNNILKNGIVYRKGINYRLLMLSSSKGIIPNEVECIGNMEYDSSKIKETMLKIVDFSGYSESGYDMNKIKYIEEINGYVREANRFVAWRNFETIVIELLEIWEDNYEILDMKCT